MRIILLVLISSFLVLPALADTPFSDRVSQMWLDGKKAEVLTLAQERLKKKPDDLAGLILVVEYQVAFMKVKELPASIDTLIAAGEPIKTSLFPKQFRHLKENLTLIKEFTLPDITPEQAAAEASKGNVNGKPLLLIDSLQAAEMDGLVPAS